MDKWSLIIYLFVCLFYKGKYCLILAALLLTQSYIRGHATSLLEKNIFYSLGLMA